MERKMVIVFGLVVSMFLQSVAAQKVPVTSPPSVPTTPSLESNNSNPEPAPPPSSTQPTGKTTPPTPPTPLTGKTAPRPAPASSSGAVFASFFFSSLALVMGLFF
ncbi:PREDICTED: cucumber peeling cupredoxin [Prunus dulcis]|uniref:PREDICTED: cucumber peeling cupredoxin n=1 Tax=Prunus dulcis TaxID=3755 RepID=A0A5E4FYU3_PRUDU|nr:PREDICTED: cucumber peeling cupredoxin [Prunus dulcis]